MSAPPDIHEWISFDEVDEQRTWVFDATYLRSNYTCIFGCGCKGILDEPAPELGLGCCNFGAHFVDDEDIANLDRHAARLEPRHMQFHAKAMKKGYLRPGDPDSDGNPTTITRLVDHEGVAACIFLNRPGFDGGAGCALHIAALEAGERPMDWKPSVCWQVPIRLEHSTDESGHLTSPTSRVEATRLGRGRRRLRVVVHGIARCVRRCGTALPEREGRHHRTGRRARLRPDGRVAGTAGLGAGTAPGVASIVRGEFALSRRSRRRHRR